MDKPRFNINEKVHITGDPKDKVGAIVSYSFDGNEFTYRVTSSTIDVASESLVQGLKTVLETELEPVKKEKNGQ